MCLYLSPDFYVSFIFRMLLIYGTQPWIAKIRDQIAPEQNYFVLTLVNMTYIAYMMEVSAYFNFQTNVDLFSRQVKSTMAELQFKDLLD